MSRSQSGSSSGPVIIPTWTDGVLTPGRGGNGNDIGDDVDDDDEEDEGENDGDDVCGVARSEIPEW